MEWLEEREIRRCNVCLLGFRKVLELAAFWPAESYDRFARAGLGGRREQNTSHQTDGRHGRGLVAGSPSFAFSHISLDAPSTAPDGAPASRPSTPRRRCRETSPAGRVRSQGAATRATAPTAAVGLSACFVAERETHATRDHTTHHHRREYYCPAMLIAFPHVQLEDGCRGVQRRKLPGEGGVTPPPHSGPRASCTPCAHGMRPNALLVRTAAASARAASSTPRRRSTRVVSLYWDDVLARTRPPSGSTRRRTPGPSS